MKQVDGEKLLASLGPGTTLLVDTYDVAQGVDDSGAWPGCARHG